MLKKYLLLFIVCAAVSNAAEYQPITSTNPATHAPVMFSPVSNPPALAPVKRGYVPSTIIDAKTKEPVMFRDSKS